MQAKYGHCLIDRHEVSHYLPHRAPMILVDRLLGIEAGVAIGEVLVRPDNPFVTAKGELLLGGAVEHMAQTAGLSQAYSSEQTAGPRDASLTGEGQFGFIVNIRSLKYQRLARLGETLRTEARTMTRNGSHSTMAFTCSVGDEQIIQCTMGLMAPKETTVQS